MFIVLSFALPLIVFAVVLFLTSTVINYSSSGMVQIASYAMLAVVAAMGYVAVRAWMRATAEVQEPVWYTYIFVVSLCFWYFAQQLGEANFKSHVVPFMDVNNLNVYNNVDPVTYRGQQLMDMGRVTFIPGSHLDLSKSMGFRNMEMFCVAPVVSGNATTKLETYDFWAVGLNCCSGHVPDFHCGEFNVLNARSGVRLLRDDQRAFFRLAVKQAEAAYNIAAEHPIFMTWMTDPVNEINAYANAAVTVMMHTLYWAIGIQSILTAAATYVITKL